MLQASFNGKNPFDAGVLGPMQGSAARGLGANGPGLVMGVGANALNSQIDQKMGRQSKLKAKLGNVNASPSPERAFQET